jgi:hypothetical protein
MALVRKLTERLPGSLSERLAFLGLADVIEEDAVLRLGAVEDRERVAVGDG